MRLEEQWVDELLRVGTAVRAALWDLFDQSMDNLASVVKRQAGDEIFRIDLAAEKIIEEYSNAWGEKFGPLKVIAEGMGADGVRMLGSGEPNCTVIIDPIDGTRAIMYQKRSAWFVAAVIFPSEERLEPGLADASVSVLVELPPSKQEMADEYAAIRGQGLQARRAHRRRSEAAAITVSPSQADTLLHGHAQVANFFPGTKRLAADLMERIVEETLPANDADHALLYDDQYPSTAGQMVELLRGSDRFTCDLRPLFHRILERADPSYLAGHTCHPYDCGGALVAQEAGVILTDGLGAPFDCPLDVHTPVHWCGYANAGLRRRIEPVVRAWLREQSDGPAPASATNI